MRRRHNIDHPGEYQHVARAWVVEEDEGDVLLSVCLLGCGHLRVDWSWARRYEGEERTTASEFGTPSRAHCPACEALSLGPVSV